MKYFSPQLQLALMKACIVLVPCYTMAYITEQMVYVVPTLAASAFFASALEISDLPHRRVDEDTDDTMNEAEYDPNNDTATDTHQSSSTDHSES